MGAFADISLSPPISGTWPFLDFPDEVDLGADHFEKTLITKAYPHVVAQYRQDVPRQSAHLFVYDDGTWQITHLDSYNPDWGFWKAVEHMFADLPVGRVIGTALALGGAFAAGYAGARLATRRRR